MLFRNREADKGRNWPALMEQQHRESSRPLLRDYFAAGIPAPETPISEVPLLALDMETTGLDEKRHAIVSIGMVPFDLYRIRFADRFYRVVRPPRPLEEKSITFHRITHSEIEQAPDLEEILGPVLKLMAGRIPVVHYRGIERPFMHAAIRARLGEGLWFPLIDTMELEARLHRQSFGAGFRAFLGRPPVSIRLYDSRERYGLPAYQAHHALTDALATAELLQAQILTHFSPQTPLSELWV